MGEIATEQNSTIILPIPLDLFKPFLESQNGSSYGAGVRAARKEEEEATLEESNAKVRSEMPE